MSNARRIAVVVVALVLAVAAFFVFRPDDTTTRDEKAQEQGGRGASDQEKDRSGGDPAERPGGGTTERTTPAEPAAEEIRIAEGKPVGEVRTLSFDSGDTVRLAFRSDAAGEVHIHGYDRYVDLKAGRTVRESFPAEIEGIFEIEEHGSGAQLAKLKVEP